MHTYEYKRKCIPDEMCVTHGDAHWLNFGIDHAGEVVWYDWETPVKAIRRSTSANSSISGSAVQPTAMPSSVATTATPQPSTHGHRSCV